jgi:SAM-dependent methyltransferase
MAEVANDDDTPWLDLGTYSSFLAYQAPLTVSWIAAMRGLGTAPLNESFSYLELGSGQGLALAVLADCNPGARFIGVEPDAGEAHRAQAFIGEAGLSNIEIHNAPLEDVGNLPLPPCDIATLSGLYSWYPKEARLGLVRALTKTLKPGGLLCVQYSAVPGNVHAETTFLLIKSLAALQEGDERQRLGTAMRRTMELAQSGALFFKQTPAAAEVLARLPNSDARLAAREILQGAGRSLSHIEVAEEMSACGLSFVGNGQLERNSMELVVPPAMRTIIEAVKGQAARELMLDYALNAGMRIDIYAKPAESAPREPAEAMAPFLLARFLHGEETLVRQQFAQRTGVDFTAGLYDDLLRLVGKTPMSVQEILDHADMRRHARARILRALQLLVGLVFIQLVRTRATIAEGPLPEKVKLASRLNAQILERWLPRHDVAPYSSPVTGMRVTNTSSDRIRLYAFLGGALEPALKKFSESGVSFTDNEGKPMTLEAFRDFILAGMPQYRAREAVVLYTLGVLAPA